MAAPIASDDDITLGGVGSSQGTDGCEFLLYRHLPQLVRLLNIESIRMYLIAEEFLSDDDMEKLTPNPPHYVGSQIVETLVKIVKGKGERGLEKFLSALRKSVNAGYQPGHEELLGLLEKDLSSTKQSPEMNASPEEVSSNSRPGLNDSVRLIVYSSIDIPEEDEKKIKWWWWCCDNISKVFRCLMITMTIACLGIGVPQLTIGLLGLKSESAFYCQPILIIAPFHIFVGGFLVALGVLLFALLTWGAVRRSLSNTNKCLYNIIVYALAILVIVLIISLISSFPLVIPFFFFTAHEVFSTGTSVSADHCNLVSYYWALVEIGIILSIVGLAILLGFFVLIHLIVKCLK